MEFLVLGPMEVRDDGRTVDIGGYRQRRLLAALLVARGTAVAAADLADALWDDDDRPPGADRAIRTYVSRLRRSLGASNVRTGGRGYTLPLAGHAVDADDLAAAVERCRRRLEGGSLRDAVALADAALRRWRGVPYADVGDVPWLLGERARLRDLRSGLVEDRFEALLLQGLHVAAAAELRRACADEPDRDRRCGQLMVALYRSGQQADALRAYQDHRAGLVERTGLEPGEELRRLERRIAAEDPALLRAGDAGRPLRAYRLTERIAGDAGSVLWRGVHVALDRAVAVRELRAEVADRADFVRRFDAEAAAVAALEHPNLVPLYDFWREPGAAYVVVRSLRGGTLAERADGVQLSPSAGVRLLEQIGAALAHAHRAGLVHGAICAEHIHLDAEGNAFLGDFALADGISGPSASMAGQAADVAALAEVVLGRLDARADGAALARVLASPPGTATELLMAVRAARPEADDAHPAVRWRGPNPYRGLRPFEEADASNFAGRNRLVAQLVERLGTAHPARFVAVVGPSGSGKSSVVRAGLVPAVRSGALGGDGGWYLTTMVPGANPLEELETALGRIATDAAAGWRAALRQRGNGLAAAARHLVPGRLLLVIDQFEELFTVCADAAARNLFLASVHHAVTEQAGGVHVVVTMRADHLDGPLRDAELAELFSTGAVLAGPLAPDELEQAIVLPARRAGASFEDGLAAEILADVLAEPGALPQLQYALTRLYEATPDGVLTVAAYRELGGVAEALARRADELYEAAEPTQRQAMRRLLGRLVVPDDQGGEARRRVPRAALGGDAHTEAVLERLGSARLVTFDRDPTTREPTVEVAHEALLARWGTLRRWLDEDREDRRLHRALAAAAGRWEAHGREAGELLRGLRLEATASWAALRLDELSPSERALLDASIDRRDVDARRERHRVRRLRQLLAVVAAALVVAVLAGALAGVQRRRAESSAAAAQRALEQANVATGQAQAAGRRAEVDRLMAEARAATPEDHALGLLLALEADRRSPSPSTEQALFGVLTQEPRFAGRLPASDGYTSAFVDGDVLVAVRRSDGRVGRWDLATRSPIGEPWSFTGVDGVFTSQASTLDVAAGRIAFGGRSEVRVLDVASGAAVGLPIAVVPSTVNRWTPVALSENGATVYVGGGDGSAPGAGRGTVAAYDVATGTQLPTALTGPSARIRRLALSPDGTRLAAGSYDGTVRVWDLASGEQLATFSAPLLPIGLAWSGDGTRLAWAATTPAANQTLRVSVVVVDVASGAELARSEDPAAATWAQLAFTPDGRRLVVLDGAGTARFLDVVAAAAGPAGPAVPLPPLVTATGTADLVVLADGDSLLLAGEELTAWSMAAAPSLARVLPGQGPALVARSADGALLAVGDLAEARVLDAHSLSAITAPLARPDAAVSPLARAVAFAPDGHHVAVGGAAGTVRVFAIPEGTPGVRLADPTLGTAFSIAFSADGSLLAVGGGGNAVVFDAATGERVGNPIVLRDNRFATVTVGFTPGGRLVAAAWVVGQLVVVEPRTGVTMASVTRPFSSAVLSPDGQELVLGTPEGAIEILDAETLSTVEPARSVLSGAVIATGVSADGDRVVVVGEDRARLVDRRDGSVWTPTLPAAYGGPAVFLDGGAAVVLAHREGGAAVWSLDAATWRQRGCALAGRNLTSEERARFLPAGDPVEATCAQWPLGG